MQTRRYAIMLVALFVPAALFAQPAPDLAPLEAREITEGVHLIAPRFGYRGPAIGNITVIEQSAGVVVVDTGLTHGDGERVVRYVRSITDRPVTAVVITHWHNDHPQGVSAIRDAWPDLRIISTEATRAGIVGPAVSTVGLEPSAEGEAALAAQGEEAIAQIEQLAADPAHDELTRARYLSMAADYRSFLADIPGTHLVAPGETFEEELLLDDPVRPVRLMFLGRANTAGDAVAWLPDERIVVTGDIVVSPTPFGFFSYPGDWLGVLGRIEALGFELLIPGHGEPQADASYLRRLAAAIEDVRAQVGPLAREGLSVAEVRERVDFAEQTAIFGTSPRRRAGFEGFWLRPMVENAWKEARGEPIVQGEGETP